jgi:hypothetical protein
MRWRQHAQAAAVDGQRLVDAELGREVGDGADPQRAGMHRGPGLRGAQVVAQLAVGGVDARPQRGVLGQRGEPLGREGGQGGDGVVVRRPEALRIDVTEELDDLGVPRPPQVARQLGQLLVKLLGRSHGGAL